MFDNFLSAVHLLELTKIYVYVQLMIHLGLNQIPDFHIMKRWTKSARDILGPNIEGSVDTEVSLPKSFRHNIMYVSALELLKLGDVSESRYRIVMKNITAAKKELREDDTPVAPLYYSSGGEDEGDTRRSTARTTHLEGLDDSGAMTSDGVTIKEPLVKRGRGRPKVTRFKSFFDAGGKIKSKEGQERCHCSAGRSFPANNILQALQEAWTQLFYMHGDS